MKLRIDNKDYILDVAKSKELGLLKEEDIRCKSWKELVDKYDDGECYCWSDTFDKICKCDTIARCENQLTHEDAIAIDALSKLMKLRRNRVGNWEPRCEEGFYYIKYNYITNFLNVFHGVASGALLTFPTDEMAQEFSACFADLIEKCKYYI